MFVRRTSFLGSSPIRPIHLAFECVAVLPPSVMVFLNCRRGLLCNKLTWFLSSPAAFYLDLQSDILFQDHCKVIVVLLLMASDSNEMGHLNKTIQLGDFCICTVRPSLSHVNARQRDTIWKLDPGRWQQLTLFSISWYVCQVRIISHADTLA